MSETTNKPKRSKWKFMVTFCATMISLALIRHTFSIDTTKHYTSEAEGDTPELLEGEVYVGNDEYTGFDDELNPLDTIGLTPEEATQLNSDIVQSCSYPNDPHHRPHLIKGVWSFDKCFHDLNDVQLTAAQSNGIPPVRNREEAHKHILAHKLVDISSSPYYQVDNLTHSMPYLVPKAQQLLNTICLNFIDSLQMKGITPHLPIITSVLRTTDDVKKLQKGNGNATTNSCHCYGTTVDISYNRFMPVTGSHTPSAQLTRWNFSMKQILSEVLFDLREQKKCYVKYEVKQGCYHLTVR